MSLQQGGCDAQGKVLMKIQKVINFELFCYLRVVMINASNKGET